MQTRIRNSGNERVAGHIVIVCAIVECVYYKHLINNSKDETLKQLRSSLF